jgi:acyl-CoA reductase-like NAD-dependent aldehyde dehydrogenase
MWPRESGVIAAVANGAAFGAKHTFDYYAGLADTFQWERPARPGRGGFGLIIKESVGVVGAIIPWNAPMGLISMKLAPALIAGCTVILKSSPEAPGEGYLIAEAAEAVGLPPGVLNVVTADREVSELLVRDPRVGVDHRSGPRQGRHPAGAHRHHGHQRLPAGPGRPVGRRQVQRHRP